MPSRLAGFLLTAAALLAALPPARADEPAGAPVLLDRVAVRWHAPETGGPQKPQFVFERELAFEARVESLADPDPEPGPYHERHVRSALDRHIAETMLASLPIVPPPDPKVVAARAELARSILEQRVRGRTRLLAAAAAEGVSPDELDALFRRHARASLYLDKMVAPMLEPSEAELRALYRSGATPFKDMPYESIAPALRRWYLGIRLAQATETYFQSARARVTVTVARRRP